MRIEKNQSIWESFGLGSQIGLSIVIPIVVGIFLGRKLDIFFNSSPRCTLTLIFLGTIVGFLSVIQIIKGIEE